MCGVVRDKGNVEQNNTRINWEVDALPLRQLREPVGLGLLSQRCKHQRHRCSHGHGRLGHKLSPSFGNGVVGRRGGRGGSSGDDEAGGSSCCVGFVEEGGEFYQTEARHWEVELGVVFSERERERECG